MADREYFIQPVISRDDYDQRLCMKPSANYFGRAALHGFGNGLLGLLLGGLLFAFVNSTAISLIFLFQEKLQISEVLQILFKQFGLFLTLGIALSSLPTACGGILLGIWLYRDALTTAQPVKVVLLKSIVVGVCLALGLSLLVSRNLGPLGYYHHFYLLYILSRYFPGWTLNICFSITAVMAASIGSGWAGMRLARTISLVVAD